MKPAAFVFHRARRAEEAIALLAEHGDDARLLAGGQSLVPMMNFRVARPAILIDLNLCDDLDYVSLIDGTLRIGAMTRQYAAQTHELVQHAVPAVTAGLALAGPRTIRNRGTVGGSIANGYSTAHLLAITTCLDAQMVLSRAGGERVVPAAGFFLGGLRTDVAPDELLREVRIRGRAPGERHSVHEGGNHVSGPAMVCVCGAGLPSDAGRIEGARLAVIGIDAAPRRLPQVEGLLAEGHNTERLDDAFAADVAGCEPESGDTAMQAFRITLARSLVQRVIDDLGLEL